jgi:uncharacterized protein (DUF1501 family)
MCDHSNHNHKPHGSALEHGQAHERHHSVSRRLFLRNLGIAGSASLLLGKTPITAMAHSPLAYGLNNAPGNRVLVLVRFKGGNDGLNTIIPLFDYGTYQAARPDIHIPQSQINNLTDAFGLSEAMSNVLPLWENGQMKVLNSVGYPDQNLSHFRSTDIWASASDEDVVEESGWMGRFLEGQYPDFLTNPPEIPPAIQIGGSGNIVFENSDMVNMSMQVGDPDTLYEIAQNGELYDAVNVPECYYGEQIGFMRTVANNTFRYAEVISQAYNGADNAVDYENGFAQQLAIVARLIKGGLGTKIYMVTLDGFDTHAGQANRHPYLLNGFSNAIKAFYDDLAAGGRAEDVLSMTFSEFGRRIEQNSSQGTDHGAASAMMLFGPGLEGNGIMGENPDLEDVDEVGNLKFGTDFRQVYATVLENWLCVDSDTVDGVLGDYFERLSGLGLSCLPTPVFEAPVAKLRHWASYDGRHQVGIHYVLKQSAKVTVRIFNMIGQPVEVLYRGYQTPGQHQHTFRTSSSKVASGYYVYSIEVQGQRYSRKIVAAN